MDRQEYIDAVARLAGSVWDLKQRFLGLAHVGGQQEIVDQLLFLLSDGEDEIYDGSMAYFELFSAAEIQGWAVELDAMVPGPYFVDRDGDLDEDWSRQPPTLALIGQAARLGLSFPQDATRETAHRMVLDEKNRRRQAQQEAQRHRQVERMALKYLNEEVPPTATEDDLRAVLRRICERNGGMPPHGTAWLREWRNAVMGSAKSQGAGANADLPDNFLPLLSERVGIKPEDVTWS